MRDNQLFSPKEVAHALGVSEASIKRWGDKGLISCIKTSGGHRKVPLHSLREYLHKNKKVLINPEVLNIPTNTGRTKDKMVQATTELQNAFIKCDEYKIRGILYDLFLAGVSVENIFDKLLAPALHQLGCNWEKGNIDAFQERRAVQICTRVLYGFDSFFPQPEKDAPVALLGTLSNDPYTIPILMVEVCLRSLGWRTEFLGNHLPAESYVKAIEMYKPNLTAISISFIDHQQDLTKTLLSIEKVAISQKSGLAIGGRAAPSNSTNILQKSLFVDSIQNFKEELPNYLDDIKNT